MALSLNQQPVFNFKIETSEVEKKGQGILFYVLPPLVIAAVFVYCYLNSEAPASSKPAAAKQVKAKPTYSTTAQFVEDEENKDESEEAE